VSKSAGKSRMVFAGNSYKQNLRHREDDKTFCEQVRPFGDFVIW
jgi:hypothetical protein